MFGELIGLWLADVWQKAGAPRPFRLIEFGPGRGTLMRDALRAACVVPEFGTAADVWLIEASPRLRAQQAQLVPEASWGEALLEIPEGPVFIIANEFFDALPVRQFEHAPDGWAERMIGISDHSLSFGLRPTSEKREGPIGTIREVCQDGEAIAGSIAERIQVSGGAALIIDYGDWDGTGDTLQAVRDHNYVDPLSTPGQADLTCHVNFSQIAQAARDLRSHFTSQGAFLEAIGIVARARQLAAKSPDAVETLIADYKRLTDPEKMGTLFKVLALMPKTAPTPPGFD
jgi:SAM-dependent MidA family methyltransferase